MRLQVTATVTLEISGIPTIVSGRLDVHGVVPGADAASLEQAAHQAERGCAVSRAIQGNIEISVLTTPDPSGSSAA